MDVERYGCGQIFSKLFSGCNPETDRLGQPVTDVPSAGLPTEDAVTYSDGITEEVYGFDVPVPALEEEFDLALIGKKGTWYDHKVSVSNPSPVEDVP